MKHEQWFFISNFDEFVDHSRSLVFNYFGEANETADDSMTVSLAQMTKEEISEMDKTLTHEESAVIIKNHAKKQINRKTKEVRYCMNDKILQSIIEDLNSRMVSNILNVLVGKGIIESAYDSEKNDFIFWIKDDETNTKQKETPETD
jgi:FtsZ-binding cell division protein ZapB